MAETKNWSAIILCPLVAGCGAASSPDNPGPTTPGPGGSALAAPAPNAPGDQSQLSTLQPTLTVLNVASTQTGARTYEFQISDRTDFAAVASAVASSGGFQVVVSRGGVAEGADGRTSFTPDQDLQPTTRFYWRARVAQGGTTSAWSATQSFNSRLVGYNRAGELYDPLIHGETVGTIIGSTTFVDGKGIRINSSNSYVRYQLPQTIPSGEFSVKVEGLRPNGPGGKLRVFSMMDGTGNLFNSKFRSTCSTAAFLATPTTPFRSRRSTVTRTSNLNPTWRDASRRFDCPIRHVPITGKPPGAPESTCSFRKTGSPAIPSTITESSRLAAPTLPLLTMPISGRITVRSAKKTDRGRASRIATCGSATARDRRHSAAHSTSNRGLAHSRHRVVQEIDWNIGSPWATVDDR